MLADVVDALEQRSRTGDTRERNDEIDFVKHRATLKVLVEFEPSVSEERLDGVSGVLVANELAACVLVESVVAKDVECPECSDL
jgi:hypothetical protein